MSFSWIDTTVVIIYVLLILYIGFFLSKNKDKSTSSAEDFILAGRKLTLPFFVATLVATWYGNILGVGEFIYGSGVVGWVCFGLPYYFAAAVFGAFMAGRIRKSNVMTIPEQIVHGYGSSAGKVSSMLVLILTLPAAYILMLGIIIQLFAGWDLWLCIIIGAVVSVGYLFTGGFKADVLTNSAQFVLMYIGFGALVFFCIQKIGAPGDVFPHLPYKHKEFFGGESWQYILTWFIISLQTFVDPSFHQRCSAATTAKTAQRGIFVSILFWMIFDSLTLLAGLYAKAAVVAENPVMAFPMLGDLVMPPFWKGIFVVALLATVMSTLDSYIFISAATIGNDLLAKIKKGALTKTVSTNTLIRIGIVATAVLCIILAIVLPSAVQLIYKTSSIGIPGLLLPLVLSFSTKYRLSGRSALIIMLASSGLSLFWTILKYFAGSYEYLFSNVFLKIEPMLPGILISVVLSLLFLRKKIINTV